MSTATRRPPKDPLDHSPAAVLAARLDADLTQQEVADACGVSRSLIAEIELGTRNATPAMIAKLAALYSRPVTHLEREREPETAQAADVAVQELPGDERAVPDDVPELRELSGGGR